MLNNGVEKCRLALFVFVPHNRRSYVKIKETNDSIKEEGVAWNQH